MTVWLGVLINKDLTPHLPTPIIPKNWIPKILTGKEFGSQISINVVAEGNISGTQSLLEDDLRWKTDLQWKTPFGGREPSVEDDLW